MSQRIRLFAAVVAAFLAFGVPGSRAQTAPSTDEAAIRQVVQQVQDGWNAHDAAIMVSV